MPRKNHLPANAADDAPGRFAEVLLNLLGNVPSSEKLEDANPLRKSRSLRKIACWKAAAISGGLALPPGPIGLLTVLPDLAAIWRLQSQMVSDIAAVYGKTAYLGQEQMLYCLFRHAASHVVRDLVVRAGNRVLVRRASLRVIQRMVKQIGMKVTQRVAGRAISRWLPVAGAGAVGVYAFYDTGSVGTTAIELFSQPMDVAGDDMAEELAEKGPRNNGSGDYPIIR